MIKLNTHPVPTTMFPDNTSQVWHLPHEWLESRRAAVEWTYSCEGELMQLAQLKDLLDHYGIPATLELPYLPYGRQDKDVGNDATFALRTFAKLINALGFDTVTIHDPHSSVALQLIDRAVAVFPTEQVQRIFAEIADVVCYPDKGARGKYGAIYAGLPFVYGEKVRDQSTGMITSYALVGDAKGKRVLIVDDICDGGATFKILARALLQQGATAVHLFVSHGLFSQGTRGLFDAGIARIFTSTQEVHRRYGADQT
jgi:ribose-phosphate pyrophosphokinase